nr:MAG TPA: hypothetical protein [Caudoviricetes sp.]
MNQSFEINKYIKNNLLLYFYHTDIFILYKRKPQCLYNSFKAVC